MLNASYTVRIRGDDVTPEAVRARDLACLLDRLERLFVETAKSMQDALSPEVSPEDAPFSLVGISAGSNTLTLSMHDSFVPVQRVLDTAIRTERYEHLPDAAFNHLVGISKLAVKHAWEMDFGGLESHATISHDRPVRRDELEGTTTLYGTCLRIGGDPPKMLLRIRQSDNVSCEVSRKLAQELGTLLYREIGVEGIGVWTARDMRLRSFKVTQLLPYRKTSVVDAFGRIAERGAGVWEDIEDVDAWVDEQRGRSPQ